MIRKIYKVYPLLSPEGGVEMKIITFIEDHKVIDKIISHLIITFMAKRSPPPSCCPEGASNSS